MFRCFVRRARYMNRPILLQRTAGAKHQWNHDLIWGTSCCTRGAGLQEESSWTASINLLVSSIITRQISSSCTYLQQSHHGRQSESIKSVIQRNKRIVAFGKEENWKSMLSLYVEEKEYFHIQNYATLMTFIARIRSVNTNHPLFLEFLDDMAYRVVNAGTLQMSPRYISNIIYAFGKMNLKNTSSIKILDWLSDEDVADVFAKRSNAQGVSNVVWAYAILEKTDARDLFGAIDKHSHRIFVESAPQNVSNTIWGFAKLGFKPHNLLSYVERHADWLVENGKPQNVANSVWAFATLEMKAPNLFAHVERHADWLVENGKPQEVANSVWSFATLGMEAPNLFAHVERHADWLVENGNPQEVANSIWAFATLGMEAPNLFAHVERHADWLVENGNPQNVANSVWAFATLGMEAPNLFAHVERHADWLVENGNPQAVANSVWAFATLGMEAPNLFAHVERHADWLVENGNPQNVANSVWAFATLGMEAPNLFAHVERHADWLVENGNPQAVANSVWAFATLGMEAPNLFAQVERHTDWLVENGDPQAISNSVWASATLGMEAPNLFAHVERHAKWLVENRNPQAISNTAWAFATVKIQAPNLFINIEKQAEWLVKNGNPQEVANTAWACAALDIKASNLLYNIEEQAEWLVRNGNPQNIANTAWAFAIVGYKSEELFKFLYLHLKKISGKSDLQEQGVTNIIYAIAVLDFSKKHERLLLHLWTIACQMDPNVFQEESMSQLVQVKLFAEADGIELPEFPLHLQKKMKKISRNDSQSRSQKKVSTCLTDLGFNHDVEVSPVDDCIMEGMLAIDMACKERKIAIEYDGSHHFMKDIKTGDITRMENGATKAKRRFLERRGWTVININYQDWIKVSKKATQKKFLRKMLFKAGVEL